MRAGSGPSYVTLSFPQLHVLLRVVIGVFLGSGMWILRLRRHRCHHTDRAIGNCAGIEEEIVNIRAPRLGPGIGRCVHAVR
jgi:hypothetical protein